MSATEVESEQDSSAVHSSCPVDLPPENCPVSSHLLGELRKSFVSRRSNTIHPHQGSANLFGMYVVLLHSVNVWVFFRLIGIDTLKCSVPCCDQLSLSSC